MVLGRLEEPAQEVLGQVHVLAELPDPEAARHADRVSPGRSRRRRVKAGDLGHRHLLFLGDDVMADRVVDPRSRARVQILVVRGVVPREHGRIHGVGVERVDVVDGRLGRLGVDGDRLAVLGHVLRAVAPEDRVKSRDGVGRLADGESDGMAELLQLPPGPQQVLPRVGRLLADLLEEVDPVAARERDEQIGDAEPLAPDVGVLPGEGVPLAVLAGQVVADVGHVGERGSEEPRVVHLEADDVVAGSRHELRRQLGRHLHALDVVDAHVRAAELREPLAHLGELDVRGRGVVHGGEQRQLTGRPGRRRPRREHADDSSHRLSTRA